MSKKDIIMCKSCGTRSGVEADIETIHNISWHCGACQQGHKEMTNS